MINDNVKVLTKNNLQSGSAATLQYSDECHVVEVPNDAKHGKCVKSGDKTTAVNTT